MLKSILVAVFFLSVLWTSTRMAPAIQGDIEPGVHMGIPPSEAVSLRAVDLLRTSHGVYASLRIAEDLKSFSLDWYYNPGAEKVLRDEPIAEARQTVNVSSQLTSIAAGLNGEFLVCSKHHDGRTQVVRYTVAPPSLIATTEGNHLALQPVVEEGVVFESGSLGQDMVKSIVRDRAEAGSYFVHFFDSNDFCRISISGGLQSAPVLIAGDSPNPIQNEYNSFLAGEHTTAGYVYMMLFREEGYPASRPFYLVDIDKDGQFEITGELDYATHDGLGLHGLSSWIEQNGTPTTEVL